MSTSVYNKIVSTINSASRDYNYSPDPNNLICIDTSNNRIGINILDPTCSLHISGGNIMVNDIECSSISAINYYYYNSISSGSYNNFVEDSISVTNVNASNVNSAIVNVSNTLDISNGRIKANYIDISSILDISRGRIISKIIYSTTIDISSTLDISRGNIISNKISSVTIDISSTLDISRGHIISNKISTFTIDISSILDISQGHIKAKTIDVSAINVYALLDISQGRIKAQTIDVSAITVSSLLDISQGHIEAKTIDASAIYISSLFDISQGHIEAKTIDASAINVSALLDISQGRIKANTIDASAISVTSLLDISQGRINAKTIDVSTINVSSLFDISQGRINSKTIDVSAITVSSLLDISRGTILANTISGSAITVNANAINSSNIVNITINNTNIGGININTNLDGKAITINNVRVATTQHIEDAFPIGVIVAYNSTTPPYGWALCDGSNNTPDLRGRFILGGGFNTMTGAIINGLTPRAINVSGGEETVMLDANTMPRHKHSNAAQAQIGGLVNYDDTFDKVTVTDIIATTYPNTNSVKNRTAGQTTGHENMPPFYVLVYIIKTSYDFCYNVVTFVPSVPSVPIILSVTDYIGSSDYGATINWIPPYDGGSPIRQYAIYVNLSFKDNALSTLTSKRIINMESGTNIIRIQAQNDIGYSLFSNEVTITIN